MAKFRVTSPDGQSYEITAPEGATEAEVMAYAQSQFGTSQEASEPARMGVGKGSITPDIREQAMAGNKSILRGITDAPMAFAEGAGDLVMDIAGKLNQGISKIAISDDAKRQNAVRQSLIERQRRALGEATEERRGRAEAEAPGSVMVSDIASGLIPVGTAAKGAKAATTLGRAVARSAKEGIIGANIAYSEDPDRLLRSTLGAVLPVSGHVLLSTAPATMNYAARQLAHRQDADTTRLIQEARAAFTNPVTGDVLPGADDLTIAQTLGDARVSRLAGQAADIQARDIVRNQLNTRINNVREVAKSLGGTAGISSDPDRARAFYKLVDDTDRKMAVDNSNFYTRETDALAASADGRAVKVKIEPVIQAYEALEKEYGNLFKLVGSSASGTRLEQTLDQLQAYAKTYRNVELNATGLRKLQEGLNAGRTYGIAIHDPKEAVVNRIRMQLQDAVRQAVDQTPSSPGADKLKAIQKEYAIRSSKRRELGDNTINDLFGDISVAQDPERAFDAFINKNPEAQKLGVSLLQAKSPEHLMYFRQRFLNRIADQAEDRTKPAMQSVVDVDKLIDGLTAKQMVDSPLFSPQEKAWAAAAAKDLRVIKNSLPDTSRVGTDIRPEEIGINVVSQSGPFMARLALRALTGLKAEQLLFTSQGRAALSTIRNLRTAPKAAAEQAVAYLSGLVAQDDKALLSAPVEQE